MRHEGAGNRHVGEMDGDRTVAANTAWRHCPTIRPGILVEPDLHPIEPFAEAAKGTATLIRTGNRRSASAIISRELAAIVFLFRSWRGKVARTGLRVRPERERRNGGGVKSAPPSRLSCEVKPPSKSALVSIGGGVWIWGSDHDRQNPPSSRR
jgi:hypothetical protein